MTCQELLERLTEYAEGTLPGNICADIRAHLEGCTPCAELEHDLADLARLCRECDRPRLPEDLKRRLLKRIQGQPRGL
jgi:anti-sigma factor (TIGR02949 family)